MLFFKKLQMNGMLFSSISPTPPLPLRASTPSLYPSRPLRFLENEIVEGPGGVEGVCAGGVARDGISVKHAQHDNNRSLGRGAQAGDGLVRHSHYQRGPRLFPGLLG